MKASIKYKDLFGGDLKFDSLDYNERFEFLIKNPRKLKVPSDVEVKIIFKECSFKQGLVFNIDLPELKVKKLEITFQNCYIVNADQDKSVIRSREGQDVSLSFFGCVLNEFELYDSTFSSLYFGRTVFFHSRLLIQNCEIEGIGFHNSLGSYYVNDKGKSNVNIKYSDDNLYLQRSKVNKLLEQIISAEGLSKIYYLKTYLSICDVKSLRVDFMKSETSGFKQEVSPRLGGGFKRELKYYLTNSDVDLLDISIYISAKLSLTNTIDVKGGVFNSISCTGESEAIINVENTKCNAFYISDFGCKKATLYNLSSRQLDGSKFQIHSSNLSNLWFNKVRLNSFGLVNFYRTTIEDTIFSATDFPGKIETVENIHYPEKREVNYTEAQYDLYRQLKGALSDMGSQIQALQMHERMYNSMSTSESLSWEDRLILKVNNFSNKHETSIWRPFWVSILLLFVLSILYCLGLPNAPYTFGWNGFYEFFISLWNVTIFTIHHVKVFFILANPVHNITNLQEIDKGVVLSTWNYFISVLSRILVAWIFYQFVSSFRKFGKKL